MAEQTRTKSETRLTLTPAMLCRISLTNYTKLENEVRQSSARCNGRRRWPNRARYVRGEGDLRAVQWCLRIDKSAIIVQERL